MDSDSSSPAALYFEDDSFVLAGMNDPDTDNAILWLSFNESSSTVSMSVYDYGIHEYTHDFKGTTAKDVKDFIAGIQEEYDVVVPASYEERVAKFLSLKDKSFGINVMLDKESSYCDGCHDTNGNDLEAFYFPPLNEGEDASLAVNWNFGCYGGENLSGTTGSKEFIKEVRKMLRNAIDTAQVKTAAEEVQQFLDKLSKVAPVG